MQSLPVSISDIQDERSFEAAAMALFELHVAKNKVYRCFIEGLNPSRCQPQRLEDIPMMPISLFKRNKVILGSEPAKLIFRSSGTSGSIPNEHYVQDPKLYKESFLRGFQNQYGAPSDYRILGLLPSYAERSDSSLVYMVNELIQLSQDKWSGTFLNDLDALNSVLKRSNEDRKPTLLIGVSFALIELAERFPQALSSTILIETGGMKGRRKEMLRSELHSILMQAFELPAIHSEYGMTELLSQAWSIGGGKFTCPPWMKVVTRDVTDPFHRVGVGRTGGLDIIDLANARSCPFIATQDLGKVHDDNSFEVLGRFDESEVRGCNLMAL